MPSAFRHFLPLSTISYLSLKEARQKNLTHSDSGSFVIRGDNTRKLKLGEKRDSVRVSSKKKFGVHVSVADIEHMPTVSSPWFLCRNSVANACRVSGRGLPSYVAKVLSCPVHSLDVIKVADRKQLAARW